MERGSDAKRGQAEEQTGAGRLGRCRDYGPSQAWLSSPTTFQSNSPHYGSHQQWHQPKMPWGKQLGGFPGSGLWATLPDLIGHSPAAWHPALLGILQLSEMLSGLPHTWFQQQLCFR